MTGPWKPGLPVRLETERYVVRSLQLDDASERMASWLMDPLVREAFNAPERDLDLQSVRRYIAGFNDRTSFALGVFAKPEGELVGFYSVFHNQRNRLSQTNVVIGDRCHWGRRAVIETRAAILDFLFETVGAEKVWGSPSARNFPSIFNYKALGFRCEGILRGHVLAQDGTRADQLLFGLLREEWRAQRGRAA